ncbi:MAG TPA: hypothetical protein VIL32_00880 [Steroidobacteraceae bacterium]
MAGRYPGGARFAFTIFDDTDDATVENVAPVYALLRELGMRTTKTVWPLPCPEGSKLFFAGQTLADPEYAAFVRKLASQGFEIAFHCATMESSTRERVLEGLEAFRRFTGSWPRAHANHAHNRENLYWGADRVDFAPVRLFYRLTNGHSGDWFQGHVPGSSYWWGDVCRERIEYVRNLTFDEVNLLRINPSMPYHDPSRPHVRWWFSATDAEDCRAFNYILSEAAQDRLANEGGVCIVATHLGKGFCRDGRVDPRTEHLLRRLASLGGWFPTVSELLDWLRQQRNGEATLPAAEWRSMQVRWAVDLVKRRLRSWADCW